MLMSLIEATKSSFHACASEDVDELGRCLNAGVGISNLHIWELPDNTINWTLLYLATVMRTPRIVRYLLDKGADASVGSGLDTTTPLEQVISDILSHDLECPRYHDCLEIARILIGVSDIDTNLPRMLQPPLQAALASPTIVKILIQAGCNIHIKSETGLTMLMLAAREGNIVTMRLLINSGVDIEERDKNPNPHPISTTYLTEQAGHRLQFQRGGRNFNPLSIYRLLMDRCCNDNTQYGISTTHLTEQAGHRLQFQRGCRNFNPLSIYRLLMDRCCNDNTQYGWTALDYARESGNSAAIDVIETEFLDRNSKIAFGMIGLQRLAEESPMVPLNIDMIDLILRYSQNTEDIHIPVPVPFPGRVQYEHDSDDTDSGESHDNDGDDNTDDSDNDN